MDIIKEKLVKAITEFINHNFSNDLKELKKEFSENPELKSSDNLSKKEQLLIGSAAGVISGLAIEKLLELIRGMSQKLEKNQEVYNSNTKDFVTIEEIGPGDKLTVKDKEGQLSKIDKKDIILSISKNNTTERSM